MREKSLTKRNCSSLNHTSPFTSSSCSQLEASSSMNICILYWIECIFQCPQVYSQDWCYQRIFRPEKVKYRKNQKCFLSPSLTFIHEWRKWGKENTSKKRLYNAKWLWRIRSSLIDAQSEANYGNNNNKREKKSSTIKPNMTNSCQSRWQFNR